MNFYRNRQAMIAKIKWRLNDCCCLLLGIEGILKIMICRKRNCWVRYGQRSPASVFYRVDVYQQINQVLTT